MKRCLEAVATDLSYYTDFDYDKCLEFCRIVFSDWTPYEMDNRPVSIEDTAGYMEDYYKF